MLETGFYSMAGTNNQLPFWLLANELGRYESENSTIQNLRFTTSHQTSFGNDDWNWEAKAEFDILINENSKVGFTELFTNISWKFLQLDFGAFANEERYLGLSASNGNLASSRNARPHPKLRLGFNRFVPIGLKWISVYGFYEEGMLNDNRHVKNTHLHHKAMYLKLGTDDNISFTAGLEHYVMWGGTHPVYGELPGWESYFDYVLSRPGGDNALPTDQANTLGNQFGTYQFEIRKQWQDFTTTLYISHPFEDRSGLELDNWRDNLYGLFLKFEDESVLEGIVLEYYYTKHQSGAFHLVPQPDGTRTGRGRDNYFNHGVYRSGVTYEQNAMGSPFWVPVNVVEEISQGFKSTRFSGFHIGAQGNISSTVKWKTMLSYLDHVGQYDRNGNDTYNPSKKLLATMVNLEWYLENLPIVLGGTMAFDRSDITASASGNIGASLSISWQLPQY